MEEVLDLKWNTFDSNFLNNLSNYRLQENLCDATLVCEEKFFPVHKLVLSLGSDYFENIFFRTPCKHPFVIIKDIDPLYLQYLLQFMYEGTVRVPKSILSSLLVAAESLHIKGISSRVNNNRNETSSEKRFHLDSVSSSSSRIPNVTENISPIIDNICVEESARLESDVWHNITPDNSDTLSRYINHGIQISNDNLNSIENSLRQNDQLQPELHGSSSESGITIVSYAGNSNQAFDNGQIVSIYPEIEVDEIGAIKIEQTEIDENLDCGSQNLNFDGELSDNNFINFDGIPNDDSSYDDQPTIDPFSNIEDHCDSTSEDVKFKPRLTRVSNRRKVMKQVSIKLENDLTDKPQYTCHYCPYECTSKPYILVHERTHLSSKPSFQCRLCYYRSFSNSNCLSHEATHSNKKGVVKPKKEPADPYFDEPSYDSYEDIPQAKESKFSCRTIKTEIMPLKQELEIPKKKIKFVDDPSQEKVFIPKRKKSKTSISKQKKSKSVTNGKRLTNMLKLKLSGKPFIKRVTPSSDGKGYKCSHCNYRSRHKKHFPIHFNIHTNGIVYDCDNCDFSSPFQTAVSSHMKRNHCKMTKLKRKIPVVASKENESGNDMHFTCQYCPMKYTRKCSVNKHEQNNHSNDDGLHLRCVYCSFRTNFPVTFTNHTKLHKNNKNKLSRCPYCNYSSMFFVHLQKHIYLKHKESGISK